MELKGDTLIIARSVLSLSMAFCGIFMVPNWYDEEKKVFVPQP